MKIALVIDDALARPDGVQEYVRTIGRAMGERGHIARPSRLDRESGTEHKAAAKTPAWILCGPWETQLQRPGGGGM